MFRSLSRASIRTLHANSHKKKVEHAQSFCRCVRGMWICVRSKDAQKQLARTSLRFSTLNSISRRQETTDVVHLGVKQKNL